MTFGKDGNLRMSEWLEQIAIERYGSLEAAREAQRRRHETETKRAATRERNKAAREAEREAHLSAPGCIYLYRFWYKDHWLYKPSLQELKSFRLELVSVGWLSKDCARDFYHYMKRVRRYSVGRAERSYKLDDWWLALFMSFPPVPKTVEQQEIKPVFTNAKEVERKPVDYSGYVYVLKEVNGIHHKIGYTSKPNNRIHTFNVKLPFRVEYDVLIKTDNMYRLEMELHQQYAAKRVDGEWFCLDEADLIYLRSLVTD